MNWQYEKLLPEEIEKRSFEIIEKELGGRILNEEHAPVIKRVIHASADFEYADTLCFSENVMETAFYAIKRGASVLTDTKMAAAGINAGKLEQYGGKVYCFISDEDVRIKAKEENTTRASASMEKACSVKEPLIIAVGNAPTALIRLYELIKENRIKPEVIIGVPVGFVNVVESKELIMEAGIPYIVSKGRKGGSNIAAAICNAILYALNK